MDIVLVMIIMIDVLMKEYLSLLAILSPSKESFP